jgi:hypothetical protein
VFDSEIDANGGEMLNGESIFSLTSQKRSFAYATVSCKDEFEKHLMRVGGHC